MSDATFTELLTPADGTAARTSETALSYNLLYNGTNFDLQRSAAGATGVTATGGPTASDAVLAVAPVTVGGRASTALPTAMSADGDVVDLWLSRNGSLNVVIRDTAGAAVSTGSQYTEDAALGAVGTGIGTLLIGRAAAAAPTSVSADADAVGMWMSRFGAVNTILRDTSGTALATSFPADAISNSNVGIATLSLASVFNGTSWDRARSVVGVTNNQPGASTDLGIAAAGIGPGYARLPAAVAATGATTAPVNAKGAAQVVFNVAGTYTGFAATVQVSYDGTNYATANSLQSYIDGLGVSAAGVTIAATAATGNVFVNTWGAQSVRLNITAVASGTATVTPTANAIGSIPGGAGSVVDTELPTAATLADATTNPTVPGVGSFLLGYNGTTWDRVRVANTGRLQVDVVTGGGGGTQYVGDAVATATPTGTVSMGLANAAAPTDVSANNDAVAAWYLRNGSQVVNLASGGSLMTGLTWGNADAVVAANVTGLAVVAEAWEYNGTTVDKVRSVIGLADASGTGLSAAGGYVYNGTNWDRWRSTTGTDGNTALTTTGVPVAGAGPGFSRRFNPANLGTVVGNSSAVDVNGASTATVQINTATTGTYRLEVTADGTTWKAATGVNAATGVYITGTSLTPTVGDLFAVTVGGMRQFRLTTVTTLGASVAHVITLSLGDAVAFGRVAIVDGSGNQITSFGGGTQYVGDAAATATPTGTMSMGLANTSAPTDVSAANDAVALWASPKGALNVILRDTGGTAVPTGVQYVEDSAITANLGQGTLVVARRDDALSALTPAQDDAIGLRVGDKGALWVQISDGSGNQITTFGVQYASDVAMGTATGTVAMGRASSPVPGSVSTDGDAVALWATGSGALVVDGGVVHDAADSGNPVKIGGKASSTPFANVNANDRANIWVGLPGQMMVSNIIDATSVGADAVNMGRYLLPDGNAATNPIGAGSHLYNGSTWDRARAVQGVATGANTDLGVAAVGVGPGYSRVPADDALASVAAGAAIDVGGASVVALQITGGATATITFEASYDGTTYFTISAQNQSTAIWSTTTTANGNFLIPVQGYYRVRANMTARTSGTFTVHKIVHFGQVFAQVSGDVAHDGVDSGNPMKVGGRARTSAITAVANNDRVDAIYTTFGAQSMAIYDHFGNGSAVVTAAGDGLSSSDAGLRTISVLMGYNGATNDAIRTSPGVTGTLSVGGRTASDGVLAIAPITVGGRASTATPGAVSTDGDVVDAWLSRNGALNVITRDTTGAYVAPILLPGGDALTGGQVAASGSTVYNGTAWDRARSTQGVTAGANTDLGITAVGIGPGYARIPAAVAATGATTATVSAKGAQQVVFDVTGTFTGFAATVQVSYDGSTYLTVAAGQAYVDGLGVSAFATAITATPTVGRVFVNTWGAQNVRLNITAVASGTATVTMIANANADLPGGSGTQYVEDVALTVTSTGTLMVGRASTATPGAMSADGDAVGAWMTRNGAQVVTISDASGNGTAATAGTVDAVGNTATALLVQSRPTFYNGTSWDRARSIQSLDASPNVDTGIPAVGVGPGWDRKQDPTGVAANSTASAVTVVVDGAAMVTFQVTTIGTTPGSMIFETQADDSATWQTAGMVIKLATGPDLRIEGSFVPAVGDLYLVRTAGYRKVRYRVNAVYASGTATVKWTAVTGDPLVKASDMGPPPHNFGYALTSVTAQYTTTQTSTTLGPAVSSTQRMVVTSYQIQVGGTTAGTMQLYFGTGAYSRGTNKAIFDGEYAPSATLKPGVVQTGVWMGAADEELKVTDSAAINPITVTVWYYLIAA